MYTKTLLSLAIASVVAMPAMAKDPYSKPNNSWITLSGTVESVSPDRCKRRSRIYAASLAEAKVGTLQIGWSVRSLDQRPLRNGFQLEGELKRILEEQARVAEEALQRSAKQSGGFLYTDDGGYEQFALS